MDVITPPPPSPPHPPPPPPHRAERQMQVEAGMCRKSRVGKNTVKTDAKCDTHRKQQEKQKTRSILGEESAKTRVSAHASKGIAPPRAAADATTTLLLLLLLLLLLFLSVLLLAVVFALDLVVFSRVVCYGVSSSVGFWLPFCCCCCCVVVVFPPVYPQNLRPKPSGTHGSRAGPANQLAIVLFASSRYVSSISYLGTGRSRLKPRLRIWSIEPEQHVLSALPLLLVLFFFLFWCLRVLRWLLLSLQPPLHATQSSCKVFFTFPLMGAALGFVVSESRVAGEVVAQGLAKAS